MIRHDSDPGQLARIVRFAVEGRFDMDAYAEALEWQQGIRDRLAQEGW